jgi:hypothetical protein
LKIGCGREPEALTERLAESFASFFLKAFYQSGILLFIRTRKLLDRDPENGYLKVV